MERWRGGGFPWEFEGITTLMGGSNMDINENIIQCVDIIKSSSLKGLGHAILGNFSTEQMVIELSKI